MTGPIHRLEDSAPDFYSALSKASGAELRRIALCVCALAINRTDLSSPVIGEIMQHLWYGNKVSDQLRLELEHLIASLDDKYLPEDLEEDENLEADVVHDAPTELFFAQARAASAVLFALSIWGA